MLKYYPKFSYKSRRSFSTVSSDTKLNLCRTECNPNIQAGGGELASKLLASVQTKILKVLAFFCHQN